MISSATSLMRAKASGALETMLDRVATYKEKTESLKAKVKKAMTYPIAVILIALIVSGILLIYVVPQFQVVFAGFGADLPAFHDDGDQPLGVHAGVLAADTSWSR